MSSPSVKGFCKAQRSQFPFEEKNSSLLAGSACCSLQITSKKTWTIASTSFESKKQADIISKDSNEVDPKKWLITSDDLPPTSCSSFCKGTKSGLNIIQTFQVGKPSKKSAQVAPHPASQLSSKPWPMAYHGIKTNWQWNLQHLLFGFWSGTLVICRSFSAKICLLLSIFASAFVVLVLA